MGNKHRQTEWYRDAVIYQVSIRSYFDSVGDGQGDFLGLISKLDYLQSLGVTAIWLMPFFDSPFRDGGYDIADYRQVHPAFGTLADVRKFLREAHRRNMRVIVELVCNHTSDKHPWFQRARISPPGSSWRSYYVWSDTTDRYANARIIFSDFEPSNWTWDPVAGAFYWHRFYHHQPDLNYEHPAVEREMLAVVDYWLGLGVDGLRLDAIPYLFQQEDGSCENLPETHAFIRRLRSHVEAKYPGRVLLAEANQPLDEQIRYFGQGDECQMAFHFHLMTSIYQSLVRQSARPLIEAICRSLPLPPGGQWALFLRNHDELTMEMLTKEEREELVAHFANDPAARQNLGIRHRLAPLLNNDRKKIELLNGLILSLPGTPVLYYGDEIGMGDNLYLGDRDSVRTPMQWTSDRNAGFSVADQERLYLPLVQAPEYHYGSINVAVQEQNPCSLLHWMRSHIRLRQQCGVFGRGTIEFIETGADQVAAFIRDDAETTVLIVANLSEKPQPAMLGLGRWRGRRLVELRGDVEFPVITSAQYPVTLGPNGFFWFRIG